MTSLRWQMLRYIVTGGSTACVSLVCVWLFTDGLGLHYLLSTNLATLTVYVYSYVMNKRFVFANRDTDHVLKGSKFIILQLTLLLTTNCAMFVCVDFLGWHYMLSIMGITVFNAVVSFAVMRSTIFKLKTSTQS
jgi:putative flippase GtrA